MKPPNTRSADTTSSAALWTRRQVLTGGAMFAAWLLSGCTAIVPNTPTPSAAAPPPTPTPAPTATPTPGPDLRHKLAQMVLVGFRGTTLDAANPIVADVRDRGAGGVVLFSYDVALQSPVRNVESPEQVAALSAGLVALASTPLLIAVD